MGICMALGVMAGGLGLRGGAGPTWDTAHTGGWERRGSRGATRSLAFTGPKNSLRAQRDHSDQQVTETQVQLIYPASHRPLVLRAH